MWGLVLAGAGQLLTGCTSLKEAAPQPVEKAMEPNPSGILAEVARDARGRFGAGKSGFVLLEENAESFKWKLAMLDAAQRSIDMQYYLWDRDEAGRVLFGRLLEAAERGVRVRVLVDDFLFDGDEHRIAELSHHPNLEVRIFNPRVLRGNEFARTLRFVMKFAETNRRMHNKAFVVDGQVAIVGGRNVGDHYYGFAEEYNFALIS